MRYSTPLIVIGGVASLLLIAPHPFDHVGAAGLGCFIGGLVIRFVWND